jgi:uncharacterized cupredoxin-like copper-binding protein
MIYDAEEDQHKLLEDIMKMKIIVLALLLMALYVGVVVAADPPSATFETQGIKSTESISVLKGSVSTSKTMVMTVANNPDGINAAPLESSEDGPGERQSTNVYTEMTDAKNGQNIEYSSTVTADTGNKVLGTYNTQAHRSIQYETDPTKDGRMTSSEQIVMDVAGNFGNSASNFLCPFAEGKSDYTPAFCNIVQMGSSMDVTYVNVVTDAAKRDIQATADFPLEASYSIAAKGLLVDTPDGLVAMPAVGSINAYMNVHTQEARGNNDVPEADFVYKESTSASGYINNFAKSMYYQDGAIRI